VPSDKKQIMTSTRTAVRGGALLAVVLGLAACGGSGVANTSTPAAASPRPSTTTSTAPAATPLSLHTAYVATDGSVTLTVQAIKSIAFPSDQSSESDSPPQTGGALVRGCVISGDGRFTWDAWTAIDAAGVAYFHFGPTGDQPKPKFPAVTSDPLAVGRCATGWVYFDLAKGAHITRVTWTSGTDSASWKVA
jgi:hypothetical protein